MAGLMYSRVFARTDGVWSLSATHMTQQLYAAVFRKRSGSSLFLWKPDGVLLAEVRSEGLIEAPFITEAGRVLFVEVLNEQSVYRLVALEPFDSAPAYEVLFSTDLFIGGPIELAGNGKARIFFIVGKYNQRAAGNPVPVRMIAELGHSGMSIFTGAAFSTAGKLCQTQDGDLLTVSMGEAYVGDTGTGNINSRLLNATRISGKHDLFSIRLGDLRVEVEPLEFRSVKLGRVSAADCSANSELIVLRSVEFPVGGRVQTVSAIKKSDGSLIYSQALPPETDSGRPNLLSDDVHGLSIGVMTNPEIVGGGSSKDISAMFLGRSGISMLGLLREAPEKIIDIGE